MKQIHRCPQWLFWSLSAVTQMLLVIVLLLMLFVSSKPKWVWDYTYTVLPVGNSSDIRISSFIPARWGGYHNLNDKAVADATQTISINFFLTHRGGDGRSMTYEVVTNTADLFSYRLYDRENTNAVWTVMVSMSGNSAPLIAVDKGGNAP